MATRTESPPARRVTLRNVVPIIVLLVSLILSAWGLVTISSAAQIPHSDFTSLPTTSLSTNGESVAFSDVRGVVDQGLTVGVKGYLKTGSGQPVVGATVYMTYYLRGAYRTQSATTDQNGQFEARFPTNWTGWLPVQVTYFGDSTHVGLSQTFSVSGEGTPT